MRSASARAGASRPQPLRPLVITLAAVALLVAPGGPGRGPGSLSLAAQAYALTSAATDEILHMLCDDRVRAADIHGLERGPM